MSDKPDDIVLKNYSLLRDVGILDYIDRLQNQIKGLELLLNDAEAIFNKKDMVDLADYVMNQLLDRFVPSYLAFIIQEDYGSDQAEILCFKNMKPVEAPFALVSMEPYKRLFSLSPTTMDFNAFEYIVGRPELTDLFKVLNPDKVMPIMGFDGVHGFIIVGKKVLGDEYTPEEMRYLDRLVKFISITFQNNIHYKQAITDHKTGLRNHSYFMLRLEEELARTRRYKHQATLLIFDVDFFKKFNDTYGHIAGDLVLAEVAKVLEDNIRTEDVAARFGGEEFVILLVQCNANYGWLIAERIRKKISELAVEFEGNSLKITASVGIAHLSSDGKIPDASSLIHQADLALYNSKERGRNRTTVYDPSLART